VSRRPTALLSAAAGCAALFVLLLVLAYGSPAARQADATSLIGFMSVEPNGGSVPDYLAHLGDPWAVILLGAVLAGIAVLRGRPRVAAVIVLLIGATSVSSQLLKAFLAYPRYEAADKGAHVAPEAFPSGHSTAAMAIALCLVVAVPARLRPLAAMVGAGFALSVAFSVIALGWHFPSDAVGGFLLASGWALVLLAGLMVLDERFPARTGRSRAAATVRQVTEGITAAGLVTLAAAGLIALAFIAFVTLVQPGGLLGVAERHTGLVVVAPLLAAAAVLLLSGVALFSRRR
jgi:membrane-associated phospholipid phosphatase